MGIFIPTILGLVAGVVGIALHVHPLKRGRLTRWIAFACYLAAAELLGLLVPGKGSLIRVVLGITAIIAFAWWDGRSKPISSSLDGTLSLGDRLRVALAEGSALVPRIDPIAPSLDVLQAARAWQQMTYAMLVAERRDLAKRFLDATDPIEERETKSLSMVNHARFIMEEHTACLEVLLEKI